ncbi:hypothetical protein FGB62_44g111 [Gracilaria domingensis]|nr:hypothetical protein FGB62_44g111 [Gracilaria domingensis]
MSLTRVHNSALLHRKVWVIPFDEMWQLGLRDAPQEECPNALGALAKHVLSGETVEETAGDLANHIKKYRRVTALHRLGKPFILTQGTDREIVYAFALPLRGVFPRKKKKWISQVMKPVDFVQHTNLLLRSPRDQADTRLREHFCSRERGEWMLRAIAYALRQFHIKGMVPRSNPMDNAAFNDTMCCKTDVDTSLDLSMCGIACDEPGLYNILSYFPHTR